MIGGLGFLGDKVILHDKPLLWKWTIWPKLDCSLTKTVTKLWPQTVTKLWPKKKEFVAGVFLEWRITKNTEWFQYFLDMGVELNGRGGENWTLPLHWTPKYKFLLMKSSIWITIFYFVWTPKIVINGLKGVSNLDF